MSKIIKNKDNKNEPPFDTSNAEWDYNSEKGYIDDAEYRIKQAKLKKEAVDNAIEKLKARLTTTATAGAKIRVSFYFKKIKNTALLMCKINAGIKFKVLGKCKAYKPITQSTGISVPVEKSNLYITKEQVFIGELAELNEPLSAFKLKCTKIMSYIQDNGLTAKNETFKEIEKQIEGIVNITPATHISTEKQTLEYYITNLSNTKMTNKGTLIKAGTKKNYKKFIFLLRNFERDIYGVDFKKQPKQKLFLNNWNNQSISDFIEHFIASHPNLSGDYLNWFNTTIKSITNEMVYEDELVRADTVTIIHKKKVKNKIPTDQNKWNKTVLTFEQLQKFQDIKSDVLLNEVQQIIKHNFFINCSLGLRISDHQRITSEDFKKNKDGKIEFENRNIKTLKFVHVIIQDKSIKIEYVKHWVGRWVQLWKDARNLEGIDRKMSEAKFNTELKVIGMRLGLHANKKITKFNAHLNKLENPTSPPLYKTLSHKVCRRTAATHFIITYHLPLQLAMFYTGHAKENDYKAYCVITDEQWKDYELTLSNSRR